MLVNNQPIIQKGTIKHFALEEHALLLSFFTDQQFQECILLREQEYICKF